MRRARRRLGALALVALVLLGVSGCGGTAPVQRSGGVDHVVIVSLPGVSWADVERADMPNLEAFVDRAAIGHLSTRIGLRSASTTDAYLSIGAGTRALAPAVDAAVAVDPDERYAGVASADLLLRRLGYVPRGITYLAAGAAIERNERSPFGARPGRLGDLLEEAGIGRAVIANADAAEGFVSDEPPPDGAYARGAATALMGADGRVPAGTVGRGLLQEDPLAPFGRRLDPEAVLRAFREVWSNDRSVTLVEASDLSRAAAYGPRATPEQRTALRTDALEEADDLLGRLLAEVDPERDAVLVVSPVSSSRQELAVAALAGPGIEPRYLRSSTTRRDGYVQLADVAPTVLALLDLDQPEEIEGRAFEVGGPGGERIHHLVDQAAAARFRDQLSPVVVPVVIAYLLVVAVLSWSADRVRPGLAARIPFLATTALGIIPGTFLAARIAALRGSTLAYLLTVGLLGVAFAAGVGLATRRRPQDAPLVAVGAVVGFFVVDVVTGAALQLNAVFGYSVAVAGRFAGMGNLAFALFGSAAVVLAAVLADRFGPRGVRAALALLVAIVLVEGLPFLGADVGGVLAMVPAFGVTALVLLGRRIGPRSLLALGGAGLGTVLCFAFVDQARPEGSRTHLARLAQHVVDGRWGPFFDSLSRRFRASFGDVESAAWTAVLVLVLATACFLLVTVLRRRDPAIGYVLGGPMQGPPRAARDGLLVLAAVGLVANDSSIAVPATMLIVAAPALVLLRERERERGRRGVAP